jgi:excisionase family DNA binding protein
MANINPIWRIRIMQERQQLLTTAEAAKLLNVSVAFLERSRWSGLPPIKFCKVGPRAVRYRLSDLDAYIEKQIRTSTTEN